MKRNDGTGFPERDGKFWRAFMPVAWVLVRVPYLRMALSTASMDYALDRLHKFYPETKEAG